MRAPIPRLTAINGRDFQRRRSSSAGDPFILDAIRVVLISLHAVAVAVAVGLMCWLDIAATSRSVNAAQFRLSSARIARVNGAVVERPRVEWLFVSLWTSARAGPLEAFDVDPSAIRGMRRNEVPKEIRRPVTAKIKAGVFRVAPLRLLAHANSGTPVAAAPGIPLP